MHKERSIVAGRLKTKNAEKRDQVETAMFMLIHAERDLDEVILRSQQAVRRTSLVADVLNPAIERLLQIRGRVRVAKGSLNEAWLAGQEDLWEGKK
jgi:hypothetical protein